MYQNKNTQLIECILYGQSGGNTQRRLQLLDQPYLRGAQTWSLETYCADDIPVTSQANNVVTAANLQGSFLTLWVNDASGVEGQGEYINLLPMVNLRSLQLNSSAAPTEQKLFLLSGQTISWDKSYITLGAAIGNTDNISFLINVGFTFTQNNNTN
jgi:hypothetical protein